MRRGPLNWAMTPESFRKIALDMPLAEEGSHMGHTDFRVKGRIFATLPPPLKDRPDELLGMVKLTPEQQRKAVGPKAGAFFPVQGAWGVRGATYVRLKKARTAEVRRAMIAAWGNAAPPTAVRAFEGEHAD